MGRDWKEITLDSSSDKIEIRSNLSNFPIVLMKKKYINYIRKAGLYLYIFSADREFAMDKSKAVEAIDIHNVIMLTEK